MLWTSLTQAARRLRKDVWFTLVAAGTLGAGIGLNTAIFSVVDGVLLKPLRVPGEERILSVGTDFKDKGRITPRLTGGDYEDLREQSASYEAIARVYGGEMGVQLASSAEFTGVYLVETPFFRVFAVTPASGRMLTEGDEERGAVVSAAFAQRNFGSARNALKQVLRFDGRAYEIAGVAPEGFHYPKKADVWLALTAQPQNVNRTSYNYPVVAKLRRGVALEAARIEAQAIGTRLESEYRDSNRNKSFALTPLRAQMVGPVRTMLLVLMSAVALVLLVACTNVANLLLARSTVRAREMALRAALGASRARLIGQMLAESVWLGLLSGALGWALAYAGTGALLRLAPANLPRLDEVQVDAGAFLFASVVAMICAVVFSLAPAWHASRVDLHDVLKQGGARGIGGRGAHRLRGVLAGAEIALAFVLALGAGLLLKTFHVLNTAELGFRTNGVLVMYAHVPATTEVELRRASSTFERILRDIRALPGVKSAAAAMGMPAGQYGSDGSYAVEGKHTFAPGEKMPHAGFRLAGPGYFETIGIPLMRGRDFSEADQYEAPLVAVISTTLARQSFPGEDPIGKRIKCGLDRLEWMTIVGVVGDVRSDSPASAPGPEIYMSYPQHPAYANELQVAVRTDGGVTEETLRRVVRSTDPSVATKFTTMEAMVSESIAAPRFRTLLIGAFAGLALLLAMAGIYGVMAYAVAQRVPELGVRIALGARRGDVARIVLGRAGVMTGVGLAVGVALAVGFSRVLETMLYGVKPLDAWSFAGAGAAVVLAALAASVVPVWRAVRVDPMAALREE